MAILNELLEATHKIGHTPTIKKCDIEHEYHLEYHHNFDGVNISDEYLVDDLNDSIRDDNINQTKTNINNVLNDLVRKYLRQSIIDCLKICKYVSVIVYDDFDCDQLISNIKYINDKCEIKRFAPHYRATILSDTIKTDPFYNNRDMHLIIRTTPDDLDYMHREMWYEPNNLKRSDFTMSFLNGIVRKIKIKSII